MAPAPIFAAGPWEPLVLKVVRATDLIAMLREGSAAAAAAAASTAASFSASSFSAHGGAIGSSGDVTLSGGAGSGGGGGGLGPLLSWCSTQRAVCAAGTGAARVRVLFIVLGLGKAVAAAQAQRTNDVKRRETDAAADADEGGGRKQRTSRFSPEELAVRDVRVRAEGVRNILAHAFVLGEVEALEFGEEADLARFVGEVTRAMSAAPRRMLLGGGGGG